MGVEKRTTPSAPFPPLFRNKGCTVSFFPLCPQKPIMEDQNKMLDAAKEGRLEEVQRLVRSGAVDVGAHDERERCYKKTALIYAARDGHLEVVRWLVQEGGSSVEERDDDGMTALFCATIYGQLEVVRWLVQEGGSSVEERHDNGMSALLCAAEYADLEMVRWLVQEGGSSVEERDDDGMTALLRAARDGHLEMVRWLLSDGGSTVDEQNNDGESLWNLVDNWHNEDEDEDDDDDNEAATACLRTCLTLGAPPDGFDTTTRLSPAQQELARKAVILRARLPAWLERRRSLVHEGLSRCVPSALGAVVQGYCEPSEEEVWDEVAGVPLGDVCGGRWWIWLRLREENARLRERVERECGKVASLEEENLRLLRLPMRESRGGVAHGMTMTMGCEGNQECGELGKRMANAVMIKVHERGELD